VKGRQVMSWMRHTYPDGPCDECGELNDVQSYDSDDGLDKRKSLCSDCWDEEVAEQEAAEREKANNG